MTKRLGKGQGEDMMWRTVHIVSEAVEHGMSDKDKESLMAKIYGTLSGGHYDEDFAVESVSKMYYIDKDGMKRHGPYWTIPDVSAVYEAYKKRIPSDYNEWDWYVTFNMIASDNWMLLHKWFPQMTQEEFAEKVACLASNWLDDPDNPYGTSKIWCYLNQ